MISMLMFLVEYIHFYHFCFLYYGSRYDSYLLVSRNVYSFLTVYLYKCCYDFYYEWTYFSKKKTNWYTVGVNLNHVGIYHFEKYYV